MITAALSRTSSAASAGTMKISLGIADLKGDVSPTELPQALFQLLKNSHVEPTRSAAAPHAGYRRLLRAQRDELASLQLIELHPIPHEPEAHGTISNWQGSVSGCRGQFATSE
jgi:hypothetical protein